MGAFRLRSGFVFTIAVVVSLVFINLLAVRHFARVDLTRDGKFTLSAASRETVAKLPDVMSVSAYFTAGLPAPYASHARYVRDMLEEYRAASNGKLSFEFADPMADETAADKEKKKEAVRDIFGRMLREPTSVERDLAQLGLQPVEIRVIEDDQQQAKRAYMGIVIRYQGKTEVIPVVQDMQNLEKDMTSLMRKLTRTKTPVVAIVQGSHVMGISKLRASLAQNVTLKDVDLSKDDALQEVDALVVIGNVDNLDDQSVQMLEQFIKSGKSAAFLVDRYAIDPQTFQPRSLSSNSGSQKLAGLLQGHGFTVSEDLVADIQSAMLNVNEQRSGMMFSMPVRYPFIPEVNNFDQESPVTRGLSGVMMPFVAKVETQDKKAEVLAHSSKASWLEKQPLDVNPRRDWRKDSIKPDGPYPLMASVKEGESRILVSGSSAFVWDQFIGEANQVLAMNVVDWLLADSALLTMRAREFVDTPIQPELSDGAKMAVKYGNILGVPFLLIIYGIIRWRLREQKRLQVVSAV